MLIFKEPICLDLSTYKQDFEKIVGLLTETQKNALEREIKVVKIVLDLYKEYADTIARIEKLESYAD